MKLKTFVILALVASTQAISLPRDKRDQKEAVTAKDKSTEDIKPEEIPEKAGAFIEDVKPEEEKKDLPEEKKDEKAGSPEEIKDEKKDEKADAENAEDKKKEMPEKKEEIKAGDKKAEDKESPEEKKEP